MKNNLSSRDYPKSILCLLMSVALAFTAVFFSSAVKAEELDEELVCEIDDLEIWRSNQNKNEYITKKGNRIILRSLVTGHQVFQTSGLREYEALSFGEIETIQINSEVQTSDSQGLYKAPPEFVFKKSSVLNNFTISAPTIKSGKDAVISAIISFIFAAAGGALTAAGSAAVQTLAAYIIQNFTVYTGNIVMNSYQYNGCTWLTYTEFVYPSGHTIGTYKWSDNPALGVAPSACKTASLKYPYKN